MSVITSKMGNKSHSVTLPGGLRIEVRRWPGGGDGAPVLCIPGLTRNARDFEDVAPAVAAGGRDGAAVSLRGRGGSGYDPVLPNYHPLTYRDDILTVLDALGWRRAAFIGTSLGGIVTMLAAAVAPDRVSAAVINDIGPELAPEGIARIVGYVGGGSRPDAADIDEAAAQIRAVNAIAFPGRDDAFWRAFARRTYRQGANGRWVLDYDQNIGRAMTEAPPAPDLWPAFAALADKPTLVVRGALSDLLTPAIVEKMRAAHPAFDYCEAAGVGHAPMLDEPDAAAALGAFLERID